MQVGADHVVADTALKCRKQLDVVVLLSARHYFLACSMLDDGIPSSDILILRRAVGLERPLQRLLQPNLVCAMVDHKSCENLVGCSHVSGHI